jgi:thiamine pyridinylase
MLDYYVRNNLISPIALAEVQDAEDYLTFAWKGCLVDGRLYAVPRLACTYVLIYRQRDDAIEKAVGLRDHYAVLGRGPEVQVPEKNQGLLIDLTGGTDCACLYLDAVSDTTGRYSLRPKLPPATDLDNEGLHDLKMLARMAGKTQATLAEPENGRPQRPAWFGEGRGRALVGYSERLYFIPKSAHDKLRVRALPMGDENKVNLFFVDMLAVNSSLRGERRRLALELINVCAAKDTLLECLTPPDDDTPSQYLLPVRASVLRNETLLRKAPLYKDLGAIIDPRTSPRAFRIGPEVRDWLNANKSLIRGRLFE